MPAFPCLAVPATSCAGVLSGSPGAYSRTCQGNASAPVVRPESGRGYNTHFGISQVAHGAILHTVDLRNSGEAVFRRGLTVLFLYVTQAFAPGLSLP